MRRLLAITVLALGASGPSPHLASAASGPEVSLLSPGVAEPVFGEVELRAEVRARDPVRWVEFYVDGQLAGRVERPPYSLRFDVGQANVGHHFRARAVDVLGGSAEDQLSTPAIPSHEEIDVELLQLFVSVSARGGRQLPDLSRGDFEIISDRGQRERIATFGGGDLPLSTVILVDSSESMEGPRLAAALAAVRTFTSQTREEDETMVALFSDRLLRVSAFSGEAGVVEEALQGARAAGGTALNDHLYYALNRLAPRLGRRVVILLTDGLDVTSFLDMEQVLWRARRSQAMLYWFRLDEGLEEDPAEAARFLTRWRDIEGNQRQFRLLEQAVAESGGRILSIRDLSELAPAFRSVIRELREQYVLGFQPARRRRDGSWRTIKVEVKVPGLQARARAGYID